jgi:hypothetical protein
MRFEVNFRVENPKKWNFRGSSLYHGTVEINSLVDLVEFMKEENSDGEWKIEFDGESFNCYNSYDYEHGLR